MRIASLLPAATEWVDAVGAADGLVARSHECDYPPGVVEDVPIVTKATAAAAAEASSKAIDTAVREQLQAGLSLYEIDLQRLRSLRPDLVLTQDQCEVCAVSRSQLESELAAWSEEDGGSPPRLLSLAPRTLKQVLDAGLAVGRAIGRLEEAMSFLAEKEKELQVLREKVGAVKRADLDEAPTVACIEWLDPLMTAGHWTPDLVEQAGGRPVLSESGARSQTVEWERLRQADPDVLAVMPCGFSLKDTLRDLQALTGRPGWSTLRAVREERVFLFDGNAYFNRPGPRLYRSAALLAAALHPSKAAAFVAPEPEEMLPLGEVAV